MSTHDLFPLIESLKNNIGQFGSHTTQLKQIISEAYEGQKTIADATRSIINALLGDYGVIVIDPDSRELKKQFIPVLKEELFKQKSMSLVDSTSQQLDENYRAVAYSRPINLFYLKDGLRERIELLNGEWKVLHSDISWDNQSELETEIERCPENFSPNVILRGLYQESILPNIAFIGGGSEVAYWMQLKSLFHHYKVFYPAIILRQSSLWMNKNEVLLQEKLGIPNKELFLPQSSLVKWHILHNTAKDLNLNEEKQSLTQVLEQIKTKAEAVDATLKSSTEAVLTKIRYQLNILEQKMLRAEKRNSSESIKKIETLKSHSFPNNSLQERFDTFMPFYLKHGRSFFDTLLKFTLPFGNQFLIIKED